uniref:CB1 cannabinoid receptor-interacting protein 1 n=1 Tax=Plectus sambesii TaxID=2011161 RepID=A0A914W6H1_9BILA
MATAGTSFQLELSIKNSETDDPIAFKVDGERFQGSTRTLKFCSNAKYKIVMVVKPPTEFYHMHIAGSDLPLHALNHTSGEYRTEWNTTGIDPTKQTTRQDISLTLQGPCGTLKKTLQSKFYNKDDSHADWGHKLESLVWSCAVDGHGTITVVNEEYK